MDLVEATVARQRIVLIALAAGVLALAAVGGFFEMGPVSFMRTAGFPVGLAGLVVLPIAWRTYVWMRERAADTTEVQAGCDRYGVALVTALAMTEGIAFLGIVCFMLGAEIVALSGVFSHVLLTGVLWPTPEKVQPFLGRAGGVR